MQETDEQIYKACPVCEDTSYFNHTSELYEGKIYHYLSCEQCDYKTVRGDISNVGECIASEMINVWIMHNAHRINRSIMSGFHDYCPICKAYSKITINLDKESNKYIFRCSNENRSHKLMIRNGIDIIESVSISEIVYLMKGNTQLFHFYCDLAKLNNLEQYIISSIGTDSETEIIDKFESNRLDQTILIEYTNLEEAIAKFTELKDKYSVDMDEKFI